jgi:hypothetical protein
VSKSHISDNFLHGTLNVDLAVKKKFEEDWYLLNCGYFKRQTLKNEEKKFKKAL